MSWVRIDDNAPDHPKLLRAEEGPAWLWVCALCYCNKQERRDGFIPVEKLRTFPVADAKAYAKKLVDVGLWEEIEGGFVVHDYHDFQPTAEQAQRRKLANRENGQRGGLASAAKRTGKQVAPPSSERTSKPLATRSLQSARSEKQAPSRSHPVPDPHERDHAHARESMRDRDKIDGAVGSLFAADDPEALATIDVLHGLTTAFGWPAVARATVAGVEATKRAASKKSIAKLGAYLLECVTVALQSPAPTADQSAADSELEAYRRRQAEKAAKKK